MTRKININRKMFQRNRKHNLTLGYSFALKPVGIFSRLRKVSAAGRKCLSLFRIFRALKQMIPTGL